MSLGLCLSLQRLYAFRRRLYGLSVYIYSSGMRRTITGRHTFSGRGALSNPPGRFDLQKLEAVHDGWYLDEAPDSIATTLEPERARSVISTNDSPDIPFERSINPYLGCETGCSYCVSGDTLILLADGRTLPISKLSVGEEIYGTRRVGHYRRYVKSRVRSEEHTSELQSPCNLVCRLLLEKKNKQM